MTDEFYDPIRNRSKYHTDRYRNCRILEDRETGEVILETRDINDIITRTTDRYHRVQSHETSRLDIIAHIYYKNPLLWWVIAQANDIYDPFVYITPGTLLRIPNLETLYGNEGILL